MGKDREALYMGLFDKFKKKNELLDNEQNEEIEAPGWDAIDKLCDKVYPNQKNPKHYGTMIKWIFGGNDPLDGISVYDGGDYWHFITYGLSELYEKESEDKEWSGYGMEFTLKLKKITTKMKKMKYVVYVVYYNLLPELLLPMENYLMLMSIYTQVKQRV